MTLDTSIAVGKPHNVHEVLAFCRALIDTPASVPVQSGQHGAEKWIGNPIGIGLCALLRIDYGVDGPMVHECWSWCHEHECDKWFDRYDGLAEFGDAHRATGADDWFRNLVVPALGSIIAGESGAVSS